MKLSLALGDVIFSSDALQVSSKFRKALYSDEYTSDRKARQQSVDFIGMKDYGARMGLPDQFQLHENTWIPLTQHLQKWLFDALCLNAYGKKPSSMTKTEFGIAKANWVEFMDGGRCFTNRAGSGTHRDYISGKNLSADLMQWEPLILGGNSVEIIGEPIRVRKSYLNVSNELVTLYPIRVLNINSLPSVESFLKDVSVCHKCTTSTGRYENNMWIHGVFPQFNEKSIYPLWSKTGKAWVWDRLISK